MDKGGCDIRVYIELMTFNLERVYLDGGKYIGDGLMLLGEGLDCVLERVKE